MAERFNYLRHICRQAKPGLANLSGQDKIREIDGHSGKSKLMPRCGRSQIPRLAKGATSAELLKFGPEQLSAIRTEVWAAGCSGDSILRVRSLRGEPRCAH